MEGDAIRLQDFLKMMGVPAPWKFDGMFIDEEREHVDLRFTRPRGSRHH